MTKQVLLLRLEGPFQSWDYRLSASKHSSNFCPSKASVVQLLARTLGYRPSDGRISEELNRGLKFGVRIESCGRLISDETVSGEHAVHGYESAPRRKPALRRNISRRSGIDKLKLPSDLYVEDAAFLVALEMTESAPPDLLSRCTAALIRPMERVQLGHRSCPPTRPIFERLTSEYESIEDALASYSWAWQDSDVRCDALCSELPVYIEEQISAESHEPHSQNGEAAYSLGHSSVSLEDLVGFEEERRQI